MDANIPLNDSLEFEKIENDGTYRVGFPLPQSVQSEEDFMTNSGRKIKKQAAYKNNSTIPNNTYDTQRLKNSFNQNQMKQKLTLEMSDSLQAQLHLSLDRLSENSYDLDDINRIKIKNQGGHKISMKTYPVIHQSADPSNMNMTQHLNTTPTNGDIIDLISEESNISEDSQNPSAHHHGVPISGRSFASQDSLNQSSSRRESDEDDIHTVVVGDSLYMDEEEATFMSPELRHQADDNDINTMEHQQPMEEDPYSHLRYNPKWRVDGEMHKAKFQSQEEWAIDFRNAPKLPSTPKNDTSIRESRNSSNASQPLDGAIIIHNENLSPTRPDQVEAQNIKNARLDCSPVRLSSDPSRLLQMNQKYEDEFNRMLEMEHQWSAGESVGTDNDSLAQISNRKSGVTQHPRSRLKPPISYQHQKPLKVIASNANTINTADIEAENNQHSSFNKPQAGSYQLHTASNKTSTDSEQKLHVPTPPKAPKSNRDYIELNKARLGRKSNSASYLEMYSKRNKQHTKDKTEQRPRSDLTRKNAKSSEHETKSVYQHQSASDENEMDLSVEDQWKQQAERLKVAKEGKPRPNMQIKPRPMLREVGNHQSVKPQYSPEETVGKMSPGYNQDSFQSQHEDSFTSESDFSSHPAFAPFHQQSSQRREFYNKIEPSATHNVKQTNIESKTGYYPTNYENKTDAYLSNQYPESSKAYQFYQTGHSNTYDGVTYDEPMVDDSSYSEQYHTQYAVGKEAEYYYPPQNPNKQAYFRVRPEDMQNQQPSPLMRAYQQHFNQPKLTSTHKQNMVLPPSHGVPMSPRRLNGDHRYQDNSYQTNRLRANSDSEASFDPVKQMTHFRKRVNFEPSVQSPPSGRSRIPVPAGLQQLYKYPVPLPPTPPANRRRSGERRSSSTSSLNENRYMDNSYGLSSTIPDYHSNHFHSVPRLPPIIGTQKSPRRHDSSYDSGIVESSPRQSLSDSEAAGGSYLQRHEKRKQKPTYKKYTLADYNNLKRDINLGGLGPDLLTAKMKMGKIDRARKYAEFIRKQHKNDAVAVQNKSSAADESDASLVEDVSGDDKQRFTLTKDSQEKKQEMKEKRKRAIEYARQVPKPKLTPQSAVTHHEPAHETTHKSHEREDDQTVDWNLLNSLRERHEREKALVAEIASSNKAM